MNNKVGKLKIWAFIILGIGMICLVTGSIITIKENTGKEKSGAELIKDDTDISVPKTEGKNPEGDSEGLIDGENNGITIGDRTDNDSDSEDGKKAEDTEEIVPEDLEEEIELIPNPYKDYFLQNPDMAAWIVVPGSVIDYPVMWTPDDEQYYLKRDFNKNSSAAGCLLLDTDTCMDPLTTNLIIHGHNMADGSMFGSIMKYESEDYMKEHKFIHLFGKDYEHIYEVMAVFRSKVYYKTDECFKFYKFFNADTEDEFNYFYDNVKDLSIYDTGVTATFGDNFITLSTCAYHVENGRFVVVAKEIEPGGYFEPLE
ncbi:MAG: class B sortase [Lachnospiraceae bacterium]|nr:class B sortase [Lachnospiraceae bacterium]